MTDRDFVDRWSLDLIKSIPGFQPATTSWANDPQSAMLLTAERAGWTAAVWQRRSDTFFSSSWTFREQHCSSFQLCHPFLTCASRAQRQADAQMHPDRNVLIVTLKRNIYRNNLSSPFFTWRLESLFISYRINNIQSGNDPPSLGPFFFLLPAFSLFTLTTDADISRSGRLMEYDINVCFIIMFFVKLSKRDLFQAIDEDRSNKRLQLFCDKGGCRRGVVLK